MGSPLGPILFNVYVADMPAAVTKGCQDVRVRQYANDTLVYVSARTAADAIQRLNVALANLHAWAVDNGMCIHPRKSVAMLFDTPQRIAGAAAYRTYWSAADESNPQRRCAISVSASTRRCLSEST